LILFLLLQLQLTALAIYFNFQLLKLRVFITTGACWVDNK